LPDYQFSEVEEAGLMRLREELKTFFRLKSA